jgi:hypothetical protein
VSINCRTDDINRLVEQVVHQVWPNTYWRSINFNSVYINIHTTTENRNLAVDGYTPFGDDFLTSPSASPPTLSENFL